HVSRGPPATVSAPARQVASDVGSTSRSSKGSLPSHFAAPHHPLLRDVSGREEGLRRRAFERVRIIPVSVLFAFVLSLQDAPSPSPVSDLSEGRAWANARRAGRGRHDNRSRRLRFEAGTERDVAGLPELSACAGPQRGRAV